MTRIAPYGVDNEDWPKRSWDFWDYGTGLPVDTLDGFVAACYWGHLDPPALERELRAFLQLPAARPMPKGLRKEIEELLGSDPP